MNGFGYVDLGLPSGLKWATCNVGATKPEEAGNKDFYCTRDKSKSALTEQVVEVMGEGWEAPSGTQVQELVDECIWTWTDNYYFTGVSGYIVKSKVNDNHIFLAHSFTLPGGYYGYMVTQAAIFKISKDEYGINISSSHSGNYYYMRAVCK